MLRTACALASSTVPLLSRQSTSCRCRHRVSLQRPPGHPAALATGPRPTGCPLCGRHARTVRCKCRWLARLLGLPSVCATDQSACSDCPVPPPPYFYLMSLCQLHRPWCPRDLLALVHDLDPFPSSLRFAPLPAPISPVDTPAPPPRPLRFAHGFTMARVLRLGLPCRQTGHVGPQAGLRSGRACW